ncbi:MAG: PD-(D/E)XK nuclease family protein [Spirochaetales bacterium]|nr:PD-(D/E)XK nuclease family protein [Spirochaetales bacterium]
MSPVHLKGEYSFTSDILLYENCPLQYKFFRALEFTPVRHGSAMFGTLVHQTIEDVHKAVLRGEEQKVNEARIDSWFNLNYQSLCKSSRAYLNEPQKKDAFKQVMAYVERHEADWSVIKEAEVDVSLVKDEYILRGKVDLVRGNDDSVEIVDFKTGKKLDVNNPEDRTALEKYRRQLEIYAHLIKTRYDIEISALHLYYTSEMEGIPTITFEYREPSVEKSIAAFGRVVDLIEQKNYDMNRIKKTKKLCENCDMQFYCNQRI